MCRKWIHLTCLIALLGLPQATVTNAADGSLVGWWKLDETSGIVAHDASGYGNDGILFGDPQWGGGGLEFDGDGDYVDCGDGPSLNIAGSVTIMGWIRLDGPADDRKIAGNQDGITGGYKLGVYGNRVEFEIRTANNVAVLNRSVGGGTILEQDVYHHVAGVYSQGQYIRTYVDGVLDRELSTTAALGTSTGTFKIGREPFRDSYFWLGLMDDVRVYNRALTAAEIQMAAMQARSPDPPTGAIVELVPALLWQSSGGVVCYNVYFGTTPDLTEADLIAACVPTSIFFPSPGLEPGTYYWRIDAVLADGTVLQGDIWSFTVRRPVGTPDNPIQMVLAPSEQGAAVLEIGEQIANALREMTGYHIETVLAREVGEMIEIFASPDRDVFGFLMSVDYPEFHERTDGVLSLRLTAAYREDSPLAMAELSDSLCFGPNFPEDVADELVQAITEHIATEEGLALWSDERFYGWTGVLDARLGFLDSLHAAVGLPVPFKPCTSYTPQPSAIPLAEVVRYVTDPAGDFELDHPMFAELYDIVFEENTPIPPALDIVEVQVESDGESHTFHIRTRAGGVVQEVQNPGQRASFGVYIDRDGNGVSDLILITAANGERSALLTAAFEPIDEPSDLWMDDDMIHMTVPERLAGSTFDWIAFSGYSPDPNAAYTTALEDVFVVPDVDTVSSVSGSPAILSFLEGPGSCQIMDKIAFGCCSGLCPGSASVPLTTIPGTTQKGKLFFRKQCGTKIYEFWCVSGFGSRVYGGGTTGWVGRCPFPCGLNSVNVWSQGVSVQLDKVYHTVKDDDCKNQVTGVVTPTDSDLDGKRDSMVHTYLYATDLLTSCNVERNNVTNAWIGQQCCPARKPYKNLSDVPGRIDSVTPCPTSAP